MILNLHPHAYFCNRQIAYTNAKPYEQNENSFALSLEVLILNLFL